MKNTKASYRVLLLWLTCAYSAHAQTGTCEPGQAETYLDVNNVRASIFNNGELFRRGTRDVYEVPKHGGIKSIYAAGIWLGGKVNNELRVATSYYNQWEFWPGPIDTNGNPPSDCNVYDRIFSIYQRDVNTYNKTGEATHDLLEWPWELGAPVTDGDGNPDNYNLAGGDRPTLRGHQTLWWVMNDRGNIHERLNSPPMGLEVQVTAFAAASDDAHINNTTLYNYKLINRSTSPITDMHFGFFQDVDLGNFDDDYVGSDSLLGLGYVYNADNFDEGGAGYGEAPPAIGIDFLQGALANIDGIDNDWDGNIDEEGERSSMTSFLFYTQDPVIASDHYNYIQGRWQNGQRLTVGGSGRDFSSIPTSYLYPGDPVTGEGWSEVNPDPFKNTLAPNAPADRKSVSATGPFTLNPLESQEIIVALIWARGKDNLDSVTELKAAARTVQDAFDAGFDIELPASAPLTQLQLLSPANGAPDQPIDPTLHWDTVSPDVTIEVEYGASSDLADAIRIKRDLHNSLLLKDLTPFTTYYWRVRQTNASEASPWSNTWSFTTSNATIDLNANRIRGFMTVQNAAGPIDPPDMAAFAFNQSGFPILEGNLTTAGIYPDPLQPTPGVQQSTNNSVWGIHTGGASRIKYDDDAGNSFLERSIRRGVDRLSLFDFEWRFSQECTDGINGVIEPTDCLAFRAFSDETFVEVPFSLWRVALKDPGPTGDLRLIPVLCEEACAAGTEPGVFDIGQDHAISDGADDPYTDWVYWFEPDIETPGEDGYHDFFFNEGEVGREYMARTVLVSLDGGTAPPYTHALPEPGTIFRIVTAPYPIPWQSSPISGSTVERSKLLYWHVIPADETRLQIDTTPAFINPVINTIVSGDSHPIDFLEPGQTYYWRTHSTYLGQQLSPWTDPWSFTIAKNVNTETGDLPLNYALKAGYPNPFSNQTLIRYAIPEAGPVKLEVFDTLGRRVRVLVDKQQSAGWQEAILDSENLPSGIYFYRLTAGSFAKTKSVILMH